MSDSLTVHRGGPGLLSLVSRAEGLDASALVRFRQLDGGLLDVFVTTPFDVIASRRIEGEISRDGAVAGVSGVIGVLSNDPAATLGPARDPQWPGALPPATGFAAADDLPVSVVRELADKGQSLARQFTGPLGPPTSLLNQAVVTVNDSINIPMRMIFTCTSLGIIPSFSAPIDVPRHVRVSTAGRWVRLDAAFGTVFHNTGLGNVLTL